MTIMDNQLRVLYMNNFNEYECLKNIYSRMTMLTAIAPIAIAFFDLLLLYILIPNIFLYSKYYKNKNDFSDVFNNHIKNLLKNCIVAVSIVLMSSIPFAIMALMVQQQATQGTLLFLLMLSSFSLFFGLLIGWIYYLINLKKSSSQLHESIFEKKLKE